MNDPSKPILTKKFPRMWRNRETNVSQLPQPMETAIIMCICLC